MNSDKLCATIGKVLPRFECSPAPQEGVRVRTPLRYPDGGMVDVFVLELGDGYMVTDFGDAVGWLRVQSESSQLARDQRLRIEELCRTLGLEWQRGQLVLRSDADDELEQAVLRVGRAAVSVAASTPDRPRTALSEADVEKAVIAYMEAPREGGSRTAPTRRGQAWGGQG